MRQFSPRQETMLIAWESQRKAIPYQMSCQLVLDEAQTPGTVYQGRVPSGICKLIIGQFEPTAYISNNICYCQKPREAREL